MNSNDMREEANNVWQKAYNTFIHSPLTIETLSAVREARMVFNAAEEAAAQQEITPDSCMETVRVIVKSLRSERDEARRMYCDVISVNSKYGRSNIQKAEELGWNCYKKETQ